MTPGRWLQCVAETYSRAITEFCTAAGNRTRAQNTTARNMCVARSKRDGTRAETRFGLSAKRTSPFKSAGVSVQSTVGSRGVRISGQRLYRPCSDIQCKAAGYPLHSHLSPSLPLPCVTVCHQVLNALITLNISSMCLAEGHIRHIQPHLVKWTLTFWRRNYFFLF